jgi:uncharacterized protein YcfL
MKNLILVVVTSFLFLSCNSVKHIKLEDVNYPKSITINSDSINNKYQDAFAEYLLSLSENERNEIINGFGFTENEKNNFIDTIIVNTNKN